jgi:uncharacterized protein YyaL (SSP411 family)
MQSTKNANRLINSTSPYLLQHAYNPVDWFEWGPEALQKAKDEDKPMLVSIGYSSCHWCHVMERECFEKENIAKVMNDFFVCIKVDREERPDIDQIYMEAVQALGINGGWPLNVFITADQKPFYGGTYFPPESWVQILTGIHNAYQTRRDEIETSAEELKQHLSRNDIERFKQNAEHTDLQKDLELIYSKLASRFDKVWGGLDKAPKFVMPSIWLWILRFHSITKNTEALTHTLDTLKRIAMGGIYDQVGGGFSRYSVDGKWFAPHFEKMLYDNAQLMSLYAEAYAITKDEEFKTILEETFGWLQREMTNEEGGFYSALDADSEGEEGKFYIWTKKELANILDKDARLIIDFYSVMEDGNWEHGNNILFQNTPTEKFLSDGKILMSEWASLLKHAKEKLLHEREKRVRPGLDDKIITAWNAMMIVGLIDAHKALGDEKFILAAIKNIQFLESEVMAGQTLYRSHKKKRSSTKGFLDDYAYVIQAYIKLYQTTFDEAWLNKAYLFIEETIKQFFDESDGYFHYSNKEAEPLISSRKEIFDNVIPSSNSVMAQNLFHLGIIFDKEDWKKMATDMTLSLGHLITSEPNYMSNWAIVFTEIKKGLSEIAIMGDEAHNLRREFQQHYEPMALFIGAKTFSSLPLLHDKIVGNKRTTIYVCYNKTCKLPVHTVAEAIKQLH